MAESFQHSWEYVDTEVYRPFAESDSQINSNSSLFVDFSEALLTSIEQNISYEMWTADEEILELRNILEPLEDDKNSKEAFQKLCKVKIPSIVPELALIEYWEAVYHMLKDEYSEEWADYLNELIKSFVAKFNLGYRVKEPFIIMPLLTAEIAKIYKTFCKECGPHDDLQGLWEDFEEAYSIFKKTGGDPKIPLTKGSMYFEAIAADFGGVARADDFSKAVSTFERSGKFPHKGSVFKSITSLYGFSSDYPGIRHPGTPTSKIRDIELHDVNHLSLMFLVWAGYMHSLGKPEVPVGEGNHEIVENTLVE